MKKLTFTVCLLLEIMLFVMGAALYNDNFRSRFIRGMSDPPSPSRPAYTADEILDAGLFDTKTGVQNEPLQSSTSSSEDFGVYGKIGPDNLPNIQEDVLNLIPSFSVLNAHEKQFLKTLGAYDENDYSYTLVTACIPANNKRADKPSPVTLTIPSNEPGRTYELQVYSSLEKKTVFVRSGIKSGRQVAVYNLIPGDICAYQIFAEEYPITLTDPDTDRQKFVVPSRLVKSGSFRILPYEMRGIRTETLHNVRDLGGWPTNDGKHVKYGLIYRGPAFDSGQKKDVSDQDAALFLDRLGIRNELDLRQDSEIMLKGASILGGTVSYRQVPIDLYITFVEDRNIGEQLNSIFDMLLRDEPLYFHCAIGCDRTGTISFLLLGLLGVSESDINKEYELSSFSPYGMRTRDSDESFYKEMIFYIKQNFLGDTLSEKIENFLLARGVPAEKIEAFRAKMVA